MLTIAQSSFKVDEYKDKLEPYWESLQTEGQWQQIEKTALPDYHSESSGFLFVYKITKTA